MRGASLPDIAIPSWFEQLAPGAAQAARDISAHLNLTDEQRARLNRLVGDNEVNKSVWHE
jgi:hypothetical protein